MHKYQTHLDHWCLHERLLLARDEERRGWGDGRSEPTLGNTPRSPRRFAGGPTHHTTNHHETGHNTKHSRERSPQSMGVGVIRRIVRGSLGAVLKTAKWGLIASSVLTAAAGVAYGGLKIVKPELSTRLEHGVKNITQRAARDRPALRSALEWTSDLTGVQLVKARTDRTIHSSGIPLATPAEISRYPEYTTLHQTVVEVNRIIGRFGSLDDRQLSTWAGELTRLIQNPQTAVGIPIRALETIANADTNFRALAASLGENGATWETYESAAQTYLSVTEAYREIFKYHKATRDIGGFEHGIRYRLQPGENGAADIAKRFGYEGDEHDTIVRELLATNNLKARHVRTDRPLDVTLLFRGDAAELPDELRETFADGYLNTLTINNGFTGVHLLFGQFVFDPKYGKDIAVCAADMDAKDRRNFAGRTISWDPRYLGQPNAYQTLSTMLRNGAHDISPSEPTVLLEDLDQWTTADLDQHYAPAETTRVKVKYSLAEYQKNGLPADYRLANEKGANGYIYVEFNVPTRTAKARTGAAEDRIAYLNGHWWRLGVDLATLAPKLNDYYDTARTEAAKGGYIFFLFTRTGEIYKILSAAQDASYDGSYGSHYAANHGVQTLAYSAEQLRTRIGTDTFSPIEALRGLYPSGWENQKNTAIDREHIFSQVKVTVTKIDGSSYTSTLLDIYEGHALPAFSQPLVPGERLAINDAVVEDELEGEGRLLPLSIMLASLQSSGARFIPERIVGDVPTDYRQIVVPRAVAEFAKLDDVKIAAIDYPQRLAVNMPPLSTKKIGVAGPPFSPEAQQKIFEAYNQEIATRDPHAPMYDFKLSLAQNSIFYYPTKDGLVFKYFERTFDGAGGIWERWVAEGRYHASDKERVAYFLKKYGIDPDKLWLNTKPLPIFTFTRDVNARPNPARTFATLAEIQSRNTTSKPNITSLTTADLAAAQSAVADPIEAAALLAHKGYETGSGGVSAAIKDVAHTLGIETSSAGKLQTNVLAAGQNFLIFISQPIRDSDPPAIKKLKQEWQQDAFVQMLQTSKPVKTPNGKREKTLAEKLRDNEIKPKDHPIYQTALEKFRDALIADQNGDGTLSFLAGRFLRAEKRNTVDAIARSLLGDDYHTGRTPEWNRNADILADSLYTGENGHLIRGQHYLIRSLLGGDTRTLASEVHTNFVRELEEVLLVKYHAKLQELGIVVTHDSILAALSGEEDGKRIYTTNIGRIFGLNGAYERDVGTETMHPLRALAKLWQATHGGELAPIFMGRDVENFTYTRTDGRENASPRGVNVWRDIDQIFTRPTTNATGQLTQTWSPTRIVYGGR